MNAIQSSECLLDFMYCYVNRYIVMIGICGIIS